MLSSEKDVDLVELGFMEARAKLLDVAAFLDRVQRHDQHENFRVQALTNALAYLESQAPDRVAKVLAHLSDPSSDPIAKAHTQGAVGAVDPRTC